MICFNSKFLLSYYSLKFWLTFFPFLLSPWIIVMQALDPLRFQNLTQTLDFHYQALANGVAQHADQRRIEIEKEKMEKASAAAPSWLGCWIYPFSKFWFEFSVHRLFNSFSNDFEKSSRWSLWSICLVQWSGWSP